MSISSTTSIPTRHRGTVRAFIKQQPQWAGWCLAAGIESRKATNAQLLSFAILHGLEFQVETILAGGHVAQPSRVIGSGVADAFIAPVLTAFLPDEAEAFNIEEDARMEALFPTNAEEVAAEAFANAPVYSGPGTFSSDSILSGVEAYLSPLVRAEIVRAMESVLQAANKPPVEIVKTVEVERIVQGSALPVIFADGSRRIGHASAKATLGSLFGIKGKHAKKVVTTWSGAQAPDIDPHYVVDADNMAMFAMTVEGGGNVWLTGPSGSGKTTLPFQFAAKVGRPVVKFSFTRQSEVAPLVGGKGLSAENGATVTKWDDGALIAAMKQPGMIIVLDELTFAPAGVQAIFQGTADSHRSYTVDETGEVVRCAPGVVFVVADNTRGFGDESGQYHGTNQVNAALINRFEVMLVIDYMSKADEAKALVNHTGIPMEAAEFMADFVARARRMPEMEGIVLSLRQMVALARTVKRGFDAKVAAQVTILNRLPAPERAVLETLLTLAWSAEFERLVTGSTAAAEALPSNSKAAGAFDDEVSASINR